MKRSDRAKQFLPFDSVKGLQEALREKEKEFDKDNRKQLDSNQMEEIESTISNLKSGDKIELTFFKNNKYETLITYFISFDINKRKLISKDINVTLDDVFEIVLLDSCLKS